MILLTYNNITDSIAGWSRRTGIPAETIRKRQKAGWTVERMLTASPKKQPNERCKATSVQDCFRCTKKDCTRPAIMKLEGE